MLRPPDLLSLLRVPRFSARHPTVVVEELWPHPTPRASTRRIPLVWSGSPAWPLGGSVQRSRLAPRQEAVDQMRAGDRLRLGATVALELGPEPAEGEQRSVFVERKPDDVLLGLRVRVWRIFRKTIGRDQAAAFRLQPAAPMRRGGVADIGDGKPARTRWGGIPQRIIVSSRQPPALRTTGAG